MHTCSECCDAMNVPCMCGRNICIVVKAGIYNSSGCLNLSFIGFNDDNPVITYTTGKRSEVNSKHDLKVSI